MQRIDNKLKYSRNPRNISEKQQELLKQHLTELGDLSGVVFCRANKAYVGGNQRSDVFNGCEITIIEEFEKPTPQKTLAHGFITYNGEKYTYREVEFTEAEFKKACVVANHDGGTFNIDILLETFELEELQELGFEEIELGIMEEESETPDYSEKNKEINTDDFSDKMEMKFVLSSEEYQFIQSELSKLDANKELALLKLLNYEP